MKAHTEPKTTQTTRPHPAPPSTDTLAQQTSLSKALRKAGVQPKLEIAPADDPLEREADEVAERVMRMPEPNHTFSIHHNNRHTVQKQHNKAATTPKKSKNSLQLTEPDFLSLRKPFIERNVFHLWKPNEALSVWQYSVDFFRRLGVSESLARKLANITAPYAIDFQLKADKPKWWEITDNELKTTSFVASKALFNFDADFKNLKPLPILKKRALHTSSQTVDTHMAVPDNIVSSLGSGQSLDSETRNYFEPRFGYDFSQVRVHTDAQAAESARAVNAKAYTIGGNIAFNTDQYTPQTSQGRLLLAHELTHILQQNKTIAWTPMSHQKIQRQKKDQESAANEIVLLADKRTRLVALVGEFQNNANKRSIRWEDTAKTIGTAAVIADSEFKTAIGAKAQKEAIALQLLYSALTVACSGGLGWILRFFAPPPKVMAGDYLMYNSAGGTGKLTRTTIFENPKPLLNEGLQSTLQASVGEISSLGPAYALKPSTDTPSSSKNSITSLTKRAFFSPLQIQNDVSKEFKTARENASNIIGQYLGLLARAPLSDIRGINEKQWERKFHEWEQATQEFMNYSGDESMIAKKLESGMWARWAPSLKRIYVSVNQKTGRESTVTEYKEVGSDVGGRLQELGIASSFEMEFGLFSGESDTRKFIEFANDWLINEKALLEE